MDKQEIVNYIKPIMPNVKPDDVTETSWIRLQMYLKFDIGLKDLAEHENISPTAYKNSVQSAMIKIGRRNWVLTEDENKPYPRWLFNNYHIYKKALRLYNMEV